MESCDQNGVCGIQYAVEADGTVYPCDFYTLDSYRLGNLTEDEFSDLDSARENLNFLQRPRVLAESCRRCEYLRFCGGGCRRTRVMSEPGRASFSLLRSLPDAFSNAACPGFRR